MTIRSFLGLAPLLLALALISACGKKDEAKPATQVAAKVNDEEITVHQVNAVLARNPNIPAEAKDKAQSEILDKLIDRTLARQQAVEKKLDRNPRVMQSIEAARTEILARAYLDQVVAAQTKPSEAEVKQFYSEHPELFAERRIFNLEEIVLEPKQGFAAGLKEQVAKARSLQDIAGWLKLQDIKFAANRGVRAAEALPLELLPKLNEMKDGTIRMVESINRVYVFRLVASQPAPIDLKLATPRIQQFLFNREAARIITAEAKRLKDQARISYMGEFAGDAAAAEARAKAQAAAKAKQLAAEKATAAAEAEAREQARIKARAAAEAEARREAEAKTRAAGAASKPAQLQQESIEKGLKGLK